MPLTGCPDKVPTPVSNKSSHCAYLKQLESSQSGCFFRVPVCASGFWQEIICRCPSHRWRAHVLVRSSAVLIGGGMRPAAATLRSAVRKLNVAHALGCKRYKWKTKWGSSVYLQITFSLAECLFFPVMWNKHSPFTVSCTSTAMPFFLSRASTDGSIRSRRAPVPSTRISARKPRHRVFIQLKLVHATHHLQQSSLKNLAFYLKLVQCSVHSVHHQFLCFVLGLYLFLVQSYGKVRHSPLWCLYDCRPADVKKQRCKGTNVFFNAFNSHSYWREEESRSHIPLKDSRRQHSTGPKHLVAIDDKTLRAVAVDHGPAARLLLHDGHDGPLVHFILAGA